MIIPLALSFLALAHSKGSGLINSQLKDYGLKNYIRLTTGLPHREEKVWKLVCKMPYNCQFQPEIELDSPRGKVLTFQSTNPLVAYLTPFETQATDQPMKQRIGLVAKGRFMLFRLA
jgi:hypothetical protein